MFPYILSPFWEEYKDGQYQPSKMQNKLAATFGMPRHLSPTHFHHFSCFSAALLLHIWMPQGMENKKKKSKRKRKICDNFVSLSLVSGRATKILGNIFSPISIFVAPHFVFFSPFTANNKFLSIAGEPLIKEAWLKERTFLEKQ